MIVLDTHVIVWFAEDNPRLGPKTVRLTDTALQRNEVAVAAISFWEIAMLVEGRRLQMDESPDTMRRKVLEQGLRELALTGDTAIAAARLPGFHGDPADRMIVATAMSVGAMLVTADRPILRWEGPLEKHDARR